MSAPRWVVEVPGMVTAQQAEAFAEEWRKGSELMVLPNGARLVPMPSDALMPILSEPIQSSFDWAPVIAAFCAGFAVACALVAILFALLAVLS
jgi:hypothetical protein